MPPDRRRRRDSGGGGVRSPSARRHNDPERRIEAVLAHDLFQEYRVVFGMGASSGGAFAAYLAARKMVEGALVMVMQLSDDVVGRIRTAPVPIYLAPMPRDENRMRRVAKNYRDLESAGELVVLDGTTCGSIPVTTEYLVQRVPGMTVQAAGELILRLERAGHVDPAYGLLRVDPTRSDWRTVVSPDDSSRWLDKFDLKPGYSPLAKALHRAWAFHEYCSEAVDPALTFFEENTTRDKTMPKNEKLKRGMTAGSKNNKQKEG